MKTIEIDGSFGEGGGQILRTALSLSCITGHSLQLFNIRKNRKKPGLMQQHLTCVNAIAEICVADVSGNEAGSTELTFRPGRAKAGSYSFDIRTAGSSSLVFQTLLPALIYADGNTRVTIRGGTHVPFSPPYNYIAGVFLPMLSRIGIHVDASIERYGFYPKGGGEVFFNIHPVEKVRGINLADRGGLIAVKGCSAVANLPLSIADRQRDSILKELLPIEAGIELLDVRSFGQGTFVFLKSEYENAPAGFSALGERGKPAEAVGREAAVQCKDFHHSPSCLDPHLADQILIYLGLAGEASFFTTSRITQHLITNLWVVRQFLDIQYSIEGNEDSPGSIHIYPEK